MTANRADHHRMAETSKPVPFTFDVDALGHGILQVDGRDLAGQVKGVTVAVEPGQPTRLVLYADRPGTITGEGYVTVSEAGSAADAVRALDPADVDRAATTLMQDIEDDPTRAVLQAVAALLEAQS